MLFGLWYGIVRGSQVKLLPVLSNLISEYFTLLNRSQRHSIIEAVVHLVNRDFAALAELYRRMGFIPRDVDTAPIVVALEVRTLFTRGACIDLVDIIAIHWSMHTL